MFYQIRLISIIIIFIYHTTLQDAEKSFRKLWGKNGDELSLLYAGTRSVKSFFLIYYPNLFHLFFFSSSFCPVSFPIFILSSIYPSILPIICKLPCFTFLFPFISCSFLFFHITSHQSNPIQSNTIQSNPIQSNRALKRDVTRLGKRTKQGAFDDGVNSAMRYFINNYQDETRQKGIDILLGYATIDGEQCKVHTYIHTHIHTHEHTHA